MRNETFTFHDVYKDNSPLCSKVTNSKLFQFNQKLINQFRVQLQKLIDNLSAVYRLPKVEGNLEILTIDCEDTLSQLQTQLSQEEFSQEIDAPAPNNTFPSAVNEESIKQLKLSFVSTT